MNNFKSSAQLAAIKHFTAKYGQNGATQFAGWFDTISLSNTYDTTFVIEEVRFQAYNNNAVHYDRGLAGVVPFRLNVLDNFAVRFKVGDVYLSENRVPLSLFCTDVDGRDINGSQLVNSFQSHSRRWRPPVPILVKPHWSLQADIAQMVGPFQPAPSFLEPAYEAHFDVNISYIGHLSWNAYPKTVRFPYILQYAPLTPVTHAFTGYLDLYNDLSAPLRIQKLVARQYLLNKDALNLNADANQYTYYHDTLPNFPDVMGCRISDNYGYDLIDSVNQAGSAAQLPPFGLLTDFYRGSRSFNRDIDAKGYLAVEFQRTLDAAYARLDIYPWLGVVGSREERT